MREFEIHSAWGCIAALLLLQSFGAIAFNAALFHLGLIFRPIDGNIDWLGRLFAKAFFPFWGLVWVAVFVRFEWAVMDRAVTFFQSNGWNALLDLSHPVASIKLFLAMFFGWMLVRMHLDYPFHKPEAGHWLTPIFLIAVLVVSCSLLTADEPGNSQVASGGTALAFLIAGTLFFVIGLGNSNPLFYFTSLMGGGIAVMAACLLLLAGDRFFYDGIIVTACAFVLLVSRVLYMRFRRRDGIKRDGIKRT